jgi:2-phosphosulfolactate phosphatase
VSNPPLTDVGFGPFDAWPPAEVHVEWGEVATLEAARRRHCVAVVDVLSFSTTVSMALDRGAEVLALSGEQIEAMGGRAAVATRFGAEVVAKDRASATAKFTLSPASLTRVVAGDRLILTSLNGALAVSRARGATALIVACLRNRRAAGDLLARALRARAGAGVTIVPCGEHWSSVADATGIRPSLEDWVGAGALAARLAELGASLSPEAKAAAAAFGAAVREGLGGWLRDCVSGRELVAKGFPDDVDFAAALDVSEVVPLHHADDDFFRPAPASWQPPAREGPEAATGR